MQEPYSAQIFLISRHLQSREQILFQSSSPIFALQGLKVGKKGAKKKIVDPFTRKDWYDVKAPSIFKVRDVGKTLVNRTQGTR